MSDQVPAIRQVAQEYIDAIKYNRPEVIARIFHPDGVFSYIKDDGIVIYANPAKRFADYLRQRADDAAYAASFKGEILEVRQHGTIASAVVRENALGGSDYLTLFILNRTAGQWIITASSSDTR